MGAHRLGGEGLSPDMIRSCTTMLGIVAHRGVAEWSWSPADRADLVLWHPAVPRPSAPRVARLQVPGHADASSHPDDLALAWPFRVMQLLELLDEAALQMGSVARATPLPLSPRAPDAGRGLAWLKDAFRAATDTAWYRTVVPGGTIRLCPARRTYWAPPAALGSLRTHGLAGATFHAMATPESEEAGPGRRVEELVWWAGRRAPVMGWSPDRPQELTRWPDMGYLRDAKSDIPSCAHLAHHPLTLEALAACTGRPLEEERSFLNACALMGYTRDALPAEALSGVRHVPTSPPPRGWRGFVARLRAHLEGRPAVG